MISLKNVCKCACLTLGVNLMIGCANPMKVGEETAKGLENTTKAGVEINGDVNGMFITTTNENNPVLLFISGGPGVPEVWLNEAYSEEYPNKIADYFTVCYWDYIGEGLSYHSNIDSEEITIERLAYDAHAVAEYLKERFNKEKIKYWEGKALLGKTPFRNYHVDDKVPAKIPVVFLSGFYDYTTPITLSRELLEKIEGSEKYFYTFMESAHSPLWEENKLVLEAMLKHVR